MGRGRDASFVNFDIVGGGREARLPLAPVVDATTAFVLGDMDCGIGDIEFEDEPIIGSDWFTAGNSIEADVSFSQSLTRFSLIADRFS
jgi:hypothetical protein